MAVLNPTLTEQGLEAVFNAQNTGVELALTHIAFGLAAYDPVGSEVALQNEVKRVPISSGLKITPSQIRLAAIWSSETEEAAITEIGFYAGDVLFAVVSRADGGPYVYKTTEADLVFSYDWKLTVVPADSVTIVAPSDSTDIALLSHIADPNAHPQYAKQSDIDEAISRLAGNAGTIAGAAIAKNEAFVAAIGARYCLLSNEAVATLPPVAGLFAGASVAFIKLSAATQPLINVDGEAEETITYNGKADTSASFRADVEAIFIWNGEGSWEVKL